MKHVNVTVIFPLVQTVNSESTLLVNIISY